MSLLVSSLKATTCPCLTPCLTLILLNPDPSAPSTQAKNVVIKGAAYTSPARGMGLNRFWLFVRDNGASSLYEGYLHLLNTMLAEGQEHVQLLRTILIVLMAIEGAAICGLVAGYVSWLMSRVRFGFCL